MVDFPDDADGDALRRTAELADMSKPMAIDFMVAVPDRAAGERVVRLASQRGYAATVEQDEESGEWTCYCTRRMLATYENVVGAQRELDELSAGAGGHSDGWGTFGNLDSD